jgi:hypothetical protein
MGAPLLRDGGTCLGLWMGGMPYELYVRGCSVAARAEPSQIVRNFTHENREASETPVAQSGSRSAGEGSGRTARVYVCEESHCGVVPMNHSNNDKQSSAESGEGRLRIKENTFPLDTYPTQCGTARVPRVGECAAKLFAWPLLIRDKNRMR